MTPKQPSSNRLTLWLVGLVVLLIVGNFVVRGYMSARDPRLDGLFEPGQRQTQSQPAAQAATATPVTVSRDGVGNTELFDLAGGNYRVSVTTQKACTHYFSLKSPDGETNTDLLATTESGTYDDNVYGVAPGQYYVDANTGPDCGWRLTLTPQ